MLALLRKSVPAITTALGAVGVAALSCSLVAGELYWFGFGAAIRVGLPALVVGAIFFPVNEKSLASRVGFALRAGFAAFASVLVHRVLWTALMTRPELPEWGIDVGAVIDVLRYPSMMWPAGTPDTTALMAASAVVGATVAGALAQPLLKRIARSRRPSVASALSSLDSTRASSSAASRIRG
jgi:hypothetical protein